MKSIKELIEQSSGIDNFKRVDPQHPVPWYVGRDSSAQIAMFCIVAERPNAMRNSKLVNVYVGKRGDGDYAITFSLLDVNYLDLFICFCEDIVDFTRTKHGESSFANTVRSRYLQWQTIFSERRGEGLSFSEIKGLIGELLFLRQYLIPLWGAEKALSCWSGIELTVQDFYGDDTWFEVKTKVSGGTTVKISSVEQLDSPTPGHLVVVTLDKTSQGDTSRITLNGLYKIMLDGISDISIKDDFKSRLLKYGYYPDEKYDEYGFRFIGFDFYRVDSTFPCVRKADLLGSVQRVKYELILPKIDSFEETDFNV